MSINIELNTLGFESVTASKEIRSFSEDKKNKILEEIISSLEKNKKEILDANNLDIQESEKKLSKAMIDRFLLIDE